MESFNASSPIYQKTNLQTEYLNPEECATRIYAATGKKLDPANAFRLWEEIVQHKGVLSEKLGRDVGYNVACIDFIENISPVTKEVQDNESLRILREFGAQLIDRSVWDTISDSQPPKQVVNNRIIRILQTGSCQQTRCYTAEDNHPFRPAWYRENSFRQSYRWHSAVVVH